MGDSAKAQAQKLVDELRDNNISAQTDLMDRSVKAQMKYANKLGVKYVVVLGDSELQSGEVELKDMETSLGEQVKLNELITKLLNK